MTFMDTAGQYYAQERSPSDVVAGDWAEREENDPM